MDFLKNVFENRIGAGNGGSSSSGGELLAHTVSFTVDGNDYAKFSVADGVKIPAPVSPVVGNDRLFKYWQDGENILSFPYTPQADKTIVAKIADDLVTELYDFYSVNPNEYAHIFIFRQSNYTYIFFCWKYDVTPTGIYIYANYRMRYIKDENFVNDPANVADVIKHTKTVLPYVSIRTDNLTGYGKDANDIIYTNDVPTIFAELPATVYQI